MRRKVLLATAAAIAIGTVTASMQQLPPGRVDPAPILAAAAKAIGTDNLKCVTVSGTRGYTGALGQQRFADIGVDWPRIPFTRYARTMNWEAGTMREEIDRKPGQNPASWKFGLGWRGGTPVQKSERQIFMVNGRYGWSQDGVGSPAVAARPEDAERWQLDLWISNPHGFLKAARLPGANPRATWRWELGEMGRDGPTAIPERVTVVSITVLGKYQVDATINRDNIIQRIHTNVPDPVFGDTNYEHENSNTAYGAKYVDAGNGIRFPLTWHHHEGWDDNYAAQFVNGAHNALDGLLDNVQANVCPDAATVPDSVRQATFPVRVETQKLAEGVYLMGGDTHNSVAVEFRDYIAVVEAPLDEARNLAVIDEIVKLIPNKPIRWVVNTHQHHDHIGGLRTYMHIGATIITHVKNFMFYNRDVLNYRPRLLEPDMVSQLPPTELAEGYYWERLTENYTLTDGSQTLHMSYVHPLEHVEGMVMAYLPRARMVIEADLLDTHEGLPAAPGALNRALYNQVQRLKLDVAQVVPIHGAPVAWSDFAKIMQ
jgi:glyoxylase-like metal-dependent hydrolase (beta-lactamase superfamily II)